MDWILGLAATLFGGGITWLVFFKASKKKAEGEALQIGAEAFKSVQDVYQQAIADGKAEREELKGYLVEIKEDRANLRKDRDELRVLNEELRKKLTDLEEKVMDLERDVARNGRMVESMRPFLCYVSDCPHRKRELLTKNESKRKK